jgi:hypothetical protein
MRSPLFILLLAVATLAMSLRAPQLPLRWGALIDNSAQQQPMPAEEQAPLVEEHAKNGQQGPLEEVHDLDCQAQQAQALSEAFKKREKTNNAHPAWLGIALGSFFQPPEA